MNLICVFIVQLILVHAHGLGWIHPPQSIMGAVNSSYSIYCTLNITEAGTEKYNSRDLGFYISDEPVSSKQIHIINETTIQLHIEKAMLGKIEYTCKVNKTKGVGMRKVFIGVPPDKVKNFKCRSYNWEYMNCSFKASYNPLKPTYKLEFRISFLKFNCSLFESYNNSYYCYMGLNTTYRQSHEYYNFTLIGSNYLGNTTQDFTVNNFDVMIPNKPNNLKATNVSSKSAVLEWNVSYKLKTFEREFIHQVNITTAYNKNNWIQIDLQNLTHDGLRYRLPLYSLPYANTDYDVRIRLRTAYKNYFSDNTPSNNTEEMWSDFAAFIFHTESRIPDLPPIVTQGGFDVNDFNDVYIYWKDLMLHQRNGDNLYYNISQIYRNNNLIGNIKPDMITNTMAYFKNISHGDLRFVIYSTNTEGNSLNASIIYVPSRPKRLNKPIIWKLTSNSGQYELFWNAPSRNISIIESYTVFWCETKSNSPNDCESTINFAEVTAKTNKYQLIYKNSSINFGVSANSNASSSGIVWASCTVTQKSDIGKLKTAWIAATQATYIEFEWKLECGDNAVLEGYNITYCSISDPITLLCKEKEYSLNITKGLTKYRIEELKPYTTYKIHISMFSKDRRGPLSDPLVNTTLEAAPSPPRNLRYKQIYNDSVILSWTAPEFINGGKMFYEVWYNEQMNTVNYNNETEIEYNLNRLTPYTFYKILVRARTIYESLPSNSINITTKIGVPSRIDTPKYTDLGNYMFKIYWNRPEQRSGNLEYYEIQMSIRENDVITEKIIRLENQSCHLLHAVCSNVSRFYNFSVRAVNVILTPHANFIDKPIDSIQDDDTECTEVSKNIQIYWDSIDPYAEHLKGNWSEPLSFFCKDRVDIYLALMSIYIMVGMIFLGLCSFFTFNKVKQIRSIKISLPDGLIDIMHNSKGDIVSDIKSKDIKLKFPLEQEEASLLQNAKSLTTRECDNTENDRFKVKEQSDISKPNIKDDEAASVNSFNNSEYKEKTIFIKNEVDNKDCILQNNLGIGSNFGISNGYIKPLSRTGYVTQPLIKAAGSGYTQLNSMGQPIINSNLSSTKVSSYCDADTNDKVNVNFI
uniref:Putative cytokine receptor n=1 Tax=Corethrella appendiculata TaxID=1370023 RepID=U5ERE7_9DIPT